MPEPSSNRSVEPFSGAHLGRKRNKRQGEIIGPGLASLDLGYADFREFNF